MLGGKAVADLEALSVLHGNAASNLPGGRSRGHPVHTVYYCWRCLSGIHPQQTLVGDVSLLPYIRCPMLPVHPMLAALCLLPHACCLSCSARSVTTFLGRLFVGIVISLSSTTVAANNLTHAEHDAPHGTLPTKQSKPSNLSSLLPLCR